MSLKDEMLQRYLTMVETSIEAARRSIKRDEEDVDWINSNEWINACLHFASIGEWSEALHRATTVEWLWDCGGRNEATPEIHALSELMAAIANEAHECERIAKQEGRA